MTSGKDTSEYKLAKYMMVAGVLLALAASVGKVPFTPDQIASYLAELAKEAAEWSKVLLPYVTAVWAYYAHLRTSLKKQEPTQE